VGDSVLSARAPRRPPLVTAKSWAPASTQMAADATVSGALPEAEMATTRVVGSTNEGGAKPLCTSSGTGMNGPATAARRSPTQPAAPVPSTNTLAMSSWSGRGPVTVRRRKAASICSGNPTRASRKPSESGTATPPTAWRARPSACALATSRSCSASSTVEASSINITGMSSRIS
jgi:hypothetical protein